MLIIYKHRRKECIKVLILHWPNRVKTWLTLRGIWLLEFIAKVDFSLSLKISLHFSGLYTNTKCKFIGGKVTDLDSLKIWIHIKRHTALFLS
jgi:hypothetical protein